MKRLFLIFIVLFSFSCCFSQTFNSEEKQLYDLIMEYRSENNLPVIPISTTLTLVAQTHVRDLKNNKPDQDDCNAHSWSSNGSWTPCCYTADHANAKLMWSKPRELTSYKGNGYEIACGSNNPVYDQSDVSAETALEGWKRSRPHNAVILNQGVWKDKWNAIGIGIYGNFAVVWFGKEVDEQGLKPNQNNDDVIGAYQFDLSFGNYNSPDKYLIILSEDGILKGITIPKQMESGKTGTIKSIDEGSWKMISNDVIGLFWKDIPKWTCKIKRDNYNNITGFVENSGTFCEKIEIGIDFR